MQTVVITGGTSGIGLATADIFLENGWNTVLIGRDTAKVFSGTSCFYSSRY